MRTPAATRSAPAAGTTGYAVVHLVVQEAEKPLIGPQVLDHMQWQATAGGPGRPAVVAVGLLEPARVALRSRAAERARELQRRAPAVRVVLLPYVSRLGTRRSAFLIAPRLRRVVGSRRIVFHCRGERAVEWAMALRRAFPGAGIVADIRGPWPEEFLFARGYDGPECADPRSLEGYHLSLSRLHEALAHAGAVISVSAGMLEWLHGLGVARRRLTYVPCCVTRTTFHPDVRRAQRAALGFDGHLVFVYLGILARYQHVAGGVLPFFREVLRHRPTAHLLVLTPDTAEMRSLLEPMKIPPERVTVLSVPQPDVPRYLAAADAGLLLRQPSRLTKVVQPVKLGEYLAAGLPVVVSRGAGRVAEMVERSGAGIVVAYTGDPQEDLAGEVARTCAVLERDGDALRERALKLCEREFLWARYTTAVRDAYRQALEW